MKFQGDNQPSTVYDHLTTIQTIPTDTRTGHQGVFNRLIN